MEECRSEHPQARRDPRDGHPRRGGRFRHRYSSLSYLTRLPIDLLKIDQSFRPRRHDRQRAQAWCSGVIGLGPNLGLQVIAEGVEREEQMNHLWQLGCDEMQGYLFSRPLPAAECLQLLLARKTLVLPDAANRSERVAP